MKNVKVILLIVLAVLLVGALGYLTFLIQDGTNPLTLLNLRASNEEDEVDPFLEDLASDSIDETITPSPTTVQVAFNSTSPTVTPPTTASPSAALSVTVAQSPTSSPTPTIVTVVLATSTPAPTTVQSLPVSGGISDHMDKVLIGGGFLILLGLLL